MKRWSELIEDTKGNLSSTSLGFILTVIVLCFSTIFMTLFKAFTEAIGMAGVLAGMTGITKAAGKWNESSVEKAQYNPDPVEQNMNPATNINIGQQEKNTESPILIPDANQIIIKRKGVKMTGKK